jgi:hypothetical protein
LLLLLLMVMAADGDDVFVLWRRSAGKWSCVFCCLLYRSITRKNVRFRFQLVFVGLFCFSAFFSQERIERVQNVTDHEWHLCP